MSNKPGGKGGGAAAKGKKPSKAGAEDKRDDALQAVIVADSFLDRFHPFTLETPRCLLPLANTPLIEYTLEFLAMNGVQEVFIYCGAFSDRIEDYIHSSPRWSPGSNISPFSSLEFIRLSDANSVGDFLRDLDKRGYIGGDFILVHSDVVANVSLDAALAKHRARREANRDACMTVVLRTAGDEAHRTKAKGITPVFVVEPSTGRCLHYEETHPLQSDHYLTLDPALLEHSEFEVRSDLIDCGIDICTPDVLALWSESFDYELPRKNFLHGVLKDWELNGKIIHAEILDEGYAARASSLQMYESISRDILGRWTYPLVPECNLLQGQSYSMTRDGACLEDGVAIGPESHVSNAVLGRNTVVGGGSAVVNSMVGRGCKIGTNVRVEDCFIWDNVTIADNVTVRRSVLASSVTVGRGASIPAGSLLSFGVVISDSFQVPAAPTSVISLLSYDGSPAKPDPLLVGPAGTGASYQGAGDEDEDEDQDEDGADPAVLQKSLLYSLEGLNVSTSSISTLASDDDGDGDDSDDGSQAASRLASDLRSARSRLSSFASDDSTAAVRFDAFHKDAVQGLVDALRADDNGDFDSAKLEFMGLRLANNASDHAMRRSIAVAFASRAAELLRPENGGLDASKAAEKALTAKGGATDFITDVGIGGSEDNRQAEQVEFTLALQKAVLGIKGLETGRAGALLAALLQQLYVLEVVEEDAIFAWWADKRASGSESMAAVKDKCRVLVEWLENADEEDSDDEDEDE